MLARVRKAVVAGGIAGAGAAISVLAKGGNFDHATVSQALGAFVAVGVAAAWTTWRVPNARAAAK